jgi:hypothetical protein
MPERDDPAEQLRQELLRQAPEFDMSSSLAGRVSALVVRRQRLRMALAIIGAAAVVAAVAIPLSSLRSAPVGHKFTPATSPTSSTTATTATTSTTTPTVSSAPFACDSLDLWSTPAGTAVSSTATLGPVTATLTGTRETTPSQDPALAQPELSIALAQGATFSEPVVPPDQANVVIPWSMVPDPTGIPNSDALCLANFPGESLPVVLVGLETGGAHCCTVVRAITVSTTGLGPVVADDVGNPGASLSPDGAHALIVTADNAFAYAFASYAESGMPLKVLQFDHGTFDDVTAQHLDLVTKDATTWWDVFDANNQKELGALAAWVADECLLGQGTSAWTTVNELQAQGQLSGPAGWPTGAAYVQALGTFLAQHGYCSS